MHSPIVKVGLQSLTWPIEISNKYRARSILIRPSLGYRITWSFTFNFTTQHDPICLGLACLVISHQVQNPTEKLS